MAIEITGLSESQVEEFEDALDECMTAFKILYVSTVYVHEGYRRKYL